MSGWKENQRGDFMADVAFHGPVKFLGPVTLTTTYIPRITVTGPSAFIGRAVTPSGLADKDDLDDADRVIGISIGGGQVVSAGEIAVSGWSWNIGDRLFVGQDGELTDVPPTSGFQQQVAVATGPTSAIVLIRQAIVLI
jgi:hypothetical protein